MTNVDILPVLLTIGAFVVLRWVEHRLGHRIGESDHTHCEEQIAHLQSELDDQRARYEARIRELEKRVDFLVGELQRAGIQLHELERGMLERNHAPAPALDAAPPKPLLLVCGDGKLCETDRQALRRAGVSFQRLPSATRQAVADELRRRRQDGTLYPWLHVTAHAGPDGIQLADAITDPSWWHEHLDGVKVVFLAACKTSTVADALAGLVTVVFVHEEIGDRDASDVTYAFWRRMREHGDPRRAYRQAVAEAPQVAEFTDIRTG